ncbi:META domain-containing protein [Streptomyces clavuligerus]|uniref:META domain-containing protein n=1 Tax=Streptomyces clavuligerus TaxID=1901 RepID=UPI0001851C98|nr:META domain-containing protein [Streptomyces clavuligerus]
MSATLTAIALLALAACGTESGSGSGGGGADGRNDSARTAEGAGLPLTGVRWTVDSVTADGRRSTAPPGAYIELTEKGRAQGSYGCNRFGAEAVLRGATLTVAPAELTTVACSDEIHGFEKTLSGVFTGRLTARLDGKRLTLTSPAGDTVALVDEGPAPLTGTTWTVTSLTTRDVSESLPAGTEGSAHLTFAKNGRIGGRLGCNTFRGTGKISGQEITVQDLVSTKRLCMGTGGQVEAHLLKVLDGTVTYRLEGRELALTGATGAGVHAVAAR